MKPSELRAPFPYFGGKSRVAAEIWQRFGNVSDYIEPFAGSLAVLLARPEVTNSNYEVVNDLDGMLVNFWRAVRGGGLFEYVLDNPLAEIDLAARQRFAFERIGQLTEKLVGDPEYFDKRLAYYWVYCVCASIENSAVFSRKKSGKHGKANIFYAQARGIFGKETNLTETLEALRQRLARVAVVCGDWERCLTPAIINCSESCGVLLDPPYDAFTGGGAGYAAGGERSGLARVVRDWAVAHGKKPNLRIALCGTEGEHDDLLWRGWLKYVWDPGRGLKKTADYQEAIWFSPACLLPETKQLSLFGGEK